jgi:SAM-dependent methyltransferase
LGWQYIGEGADVEAIADAPYDAVLSSHALEHMANPLRALYAWRRILRAGGNLLLVVPDPGGSFDHRRPPTKLEHLLEDFEQQVGEDDLTHLEEWLTLIDLDRAGLRGRQDELRARSLRNAENRGLHHHVFDAALVEGVLGHVGFEVLALEALAPVHLVALGHKPGGAQAR